MEAMPECKFDITGPVEAAFANRNTHQTENGRRLFVEIPDEDGFAGHMDGLHGLGIAEAGDEIVIEADYAHSSRNSRVQDVLRVTISTGEVSHTRYQDGQPRLIRELFQNQAERLVLDYLNEAYWGVSLNGLSQNTEYKFFSPELQTEPAEASDDKKEA